ncbi:hypothetical protein FB45DRAFT_958546 [Roridomyces roridus]|uniref:Uncharacterized protein n=1 Tax=Roridomyces roridus TaxID=1738132 RepID=A0AAD7AY02_9AGAR|nr:hypothetical protein FB45DRAFT_958546 [Roridomyces roridus]
MPWLSPHASRRQALVFGFQGTLLVSGLLGSCSSHGADVGSIHSEDRRRRIGKVCREAGEARRAMRGGRSVSPPVYSRFGFSHPGSCSAAFCVLVVSSPALRPSSLPMPVLRHAILSGGAALLGKRESGAVDAVPL